MSFPKHNSPNYSNLKAEGLLAGIPIVRNRYLRRYRVFFVVTRRMARWDQKALAMRYLYLELEACDFEFFVSKADPDKGFYCEFTSFAVEGI